MELKQNLIFDEQVEIPHGQESNCTVKIKEYSHSNVKKKQGNLQQPHQTDT